MLKATTPPNPSAPFLVPRPNVLVKSATYIMIFPELFRRIPIAQQTRLAMSPFPASPSERFLGGVELTFQRLSSISSRHRDVRR